MPSLSKAHSPPDVKRRPPQTTLGQRLWLRSAPNGSWPFSTAHISPSGKPSPAKHWVKRRREEKRSHGQGKKISGLDPREREGGLGVWARQTPRESLRTLWSPGHQGRGFGHFLGCVFGANDQFFLTPHLTPKKWVPKIRSPGGGSGYPNGEWGGRPPPPGLQKNTCFIVRCMGGMHVAFCWWCDISLSLIPNCCLRTHCPWFQPKMSAIPLGFEALPFPENLNCCVCLEPMLKAVTLSLTSAWRFT